MTRSCNRKCTFVRDAHATADASNQKLELAIAETSQSGSHATGDRKMTAVVMGEDT